VIFIFREREEVGIVDIGLQKKKDPFESFLSTQEGVIMKR